jgi:hypothetical protein
MTGPTESAEALAEPFGLAAVNPSPRCLDLDVRHPGGRVAEPDQPEDTRRAIARHCSRTSTKRYEGKSMATARFVSILGAKMALAREQFALWQRASAGPAHGGATAATGFSVKARLRYRRLKSPLARRRPHASPRPRRAFTAERFGRADR